MIKLLVIALFQTCLFWPVQSRDWAHYDNERYAYGIDVPPGYLEVGKSFTEDGMIFYNREEAASLRVWGGRLQGDFQAEVMLAVEYAQVENGLDLLGQEVTPRSARFAGVIATNSSYQRMILLCGDATYAAFQLLYPVDDAERAGEVVARLERSFQATDC